MKQWRNLWGRIVSFENLLEAWKVARRGKRSRPDVAGFSLVAERELLQLHRDLVARSYVPAPYQNFRIYDRKPRVISKAAFRDRVVHHALMRVVEPLIDRQFIYDSWACRKGKGVHAAVDRYQLWSCRYAYCLKLDIAKYFPSIDHPICLGRLDERIDDDRTNWLFGQIINSYDSDRGEPDITYYSGDDLFAPLHRRKGLPIGNLTSQFLGNLYLDPLDHYIKETLRVPAYLRYVDDLVLLANSKAELNEWRDAIVEFLDSIRLRLRPGQHHVQRTVSGVDIFGYRVFPGYRRLRAENGYRYRRRLRTLAARYRRREIELDDVSASVNSWVGHACHADTTQLREHILGSVVFKRGCS